MGLSYSDNFEEYYKIAGFTVAVNVHKIVIERTVYDFLNFLGDCGGLDKILMFFSTLTLSKIIGNF